MPARDYLDLVLRFAGRETDIGVLQSLHGQARTALDHYSAPHGQERAARRAGRGRAARTAAGRAGQRPPAGLGPAFFAAVASTAADLQLLQGLLDGTAKIDGLDVDQELRWTFLEPLAAHGAADEDAIAAELARDDTASGQRHQVRCLAARPSAEVKAQAWAQVVESDVLSNALVEATIAGLRAARAAGAAGARTRPRYFAAIERVWRERSIEIAMDVVRGLFPSWLVEQATLDAADGWLDGHPQAAPALRRLVLEKRDDLARALRAQACDEAAGPRP